jgi:hypothetical protein
MIVRLEYLVTGTCAPVFECASADKIACFLAKAAHVATDEVLSLMLTLSMVC